jgi:hypothetical protein
MRILRFILTSGLLIGVIAVLGFFIGREVWLEVASAQVRSAAQELRQIARNPQGYAEQCLQRGSLRGQSLIESLQVRFIDDRSYVIEAVCNQFRLDPIVINSGTLPLFVTKLPGSSGITWGEKSSGVTVALWGRTRSVLVENEEITKPSSIDLKRVSGPVTSCQGYGYQCCDAAVSMGEGEPFAQVLDCPKSCFASCQARPILLSFSSDPFPDPATRELEARAGEPITFSYILELPSGRVPTVTVDYGDGEVATSAKDNDSLSHTYSCLQALCRYQVDLKVVDDTGSTTNETPISRLIVNVSGT